MTGKEEEDGGGGGGGVGSVEEGWEERRNGASKQCEHTTLLCPKPLKTFEVRKSHTLHTGAAHVNFKINDKKSVIIGGAVEGRMERIN